MSFDPDNEQEFVQQKNAQQPHNYARFHRVWKRNKFKSQAEGREVGEWKDFVIIISPGQGKTEVDREVREEDKRDYRDQWLAYKENREQMDGGTPLTILPGMDEGRAASFKVLYCMTIEQLANLSDAGVQAAGMGATEWRERAKKYMQSHGETTKALEAAKGKIEAQQAQIATLQAQMQELIDAKPKRGRPRLKAA